MNDKSRQEHTDQVLLEEYERNELALLVQEWQDVRNTRPSVSCDLADAPVDLHDEQDALSRLASIVRAPEPRTDRLAWETGRIVFSGGVPVGGHASLALHSNGAYNFTGYARTSGFFSYNYSFAWAIRDSRVPATVYLFAANGRLHGTVESGPRHFEWSQSGVNPALAAGWPALMRGWSWRWQARANVDFGAFLDAIVRAVAAGTAVGNVVKFIVSDARLKRDISLLGRARSGLGIYRYRYLWSDVFYIGVLAQEVAAIAPHAVMRGADGWLRVSYAKLGLPFMTFNDHWSRDLNESASPLPVSV